MFYIRGISHLSDISFMKHYSIKAHDIEASNLIWGVNLLLVPCWPILQINWNQLDLFLQSLLPITAVFLLKKKKHKRDDTYKKFQTSDSKTIMENLSPVIMKKNTFRLYKQGIPSLSVA